MNKEKAVKLVSLLEESIKNSERVKKAIRVIDDNIFYIEINDRDIKKIDFYIDFEAVSLFRPYYYLGINKVDKHNFSYYTVYRSFKGAVKALNEYLGNNG